MTEQSPPFALPDSFKHGPNVPADLGSAMADFWLEDNDQKRIKELKRVQVRGTQLLQPKDRVHITVPGISSSDAFRCFVNGKAFIQFGGGDPIQCLNEDGNDSESIWLLLREPLDIPHSDQNGCEIRFLLFGFPTFYGNHDVTVQEGDGDPYKTSWWRCGRINLEVDDWEILISAHEKTQDWNKKIRKSGGLAATHVGCITKKGKEDDDISWDDTRKIIKCLHHFLSFARGHWQPLGYVRLLSHNEVCVHEMWGLFRGGDYLNQSSMTWWSPHPAANQLSDAFSGFWKLWNNPSWNDLLPEIIYWYLQANLAGKGHLGCDSALILSQSTLEKLSWLYATQIRKAVSEEAFKPGKLRASDQLRLLATLADLPHEIPDLLESLKEDEKGQQFEDAFHAITLIRNQLVHPKKKRKLKPKAEFQAWNLSQWYVEMCLLRFMGYQGSYANRVRTEKWVGETELVPWAKPAKEEEA